VLIVLNRYLPESPRFSLFAGGLDEFSIPVDQFVNSEYCLDYS